MTMTPYRTNYQSALAGTVVAIKTTGGKLYGIEASNGGTVSTWIQFFDLAAADITLGTTALKMTLMVPKGVSATDAGGMDKNWPPGISFETAIRVAATTAPDGGTGASIALDVNFFFV